MNNLPQRLLAILVVAALIVPMPVWAGSNSDKTSIVAATENPDMLKQFGSLSFPDGKQLFFQADSGKTIAIACSNVTHASYMTKSKTLKKVAIPAVSAAIFTMGLSLFALAIRGRGYFLAVDYGKSQQIVFSLGKNVYAQDVNATSACTGKPTEVMK
jgi:hypothetical protein